MFERHCMPWKMRKMVSGARRNLPGATCLLLYSSVSAQPIAQGYDRFLGVGTSAGIWSGLDQYWNQATPGNDGKWGSVEGIQGQYN